MEKKKNKLAFPTLASTRGDEKSEEGNPKYKTQSCTLLPSWLGSLHRSWLYFFYALLLFFFIVERVYYELN
jgi:hypothetical protein